MLYQGERKGMGERGWGRVKGRAYGMGEGGGEGEGGVEEEGEGEYSLLHCTEVCCRIKT